MEKPKLKNLADLSSSELKAFLDSFDNVLCDCDGVLWLLHTPIGETQKCISKLKEIGKRIGVVTNNATRKPEEFQETFNKLNFDIHADDVIYPTPAIIHYLKTIGFEKEIFLLGTTILKNELVKAGFKVADPGEPFIEERFSAIAKHLSDTNDNIGAVIFDFDINCTYIKMAKAFLYLHKPEVLYIIGASDKSGPLGMTYPILGPGGLQQTFQELTGKPYISLGKPGNEFNEFVKYKFNIKDTSRTIFIGDSLPQDIKFANMHGYQSLLVLTGLSTLEEAQTCSEDMTPNYYLNSLVDLYTLITTKLNM